MIASGGRVTLNPPASTMVSVPLNGRVRCSARPISTSAERVAGEAWTVLMKRFVTE